ncbi:hypothetical protein HPS54_09495 [Prevotella sp. PCHR]|uniref:CDP-glycerol:poly(Glycerophosphate) glycerophosphotransferase n=1 Tax=Xylanibacter caecicola TaxID=2736294 RepID=A0ABX2B5K6_9BACT|nr:CDP-glycerol glycerophosphotransferase family protein [Xylanibacter caecicola]NPE25743.1 hypothetical protein [Xylanibacter caecicola]
MFGVKTKIKQFIETGKVFCYNNIILPYKVHKIRNKEKITVLFLVSELSPWKTEELFLAMKDQPRFTPVLGLFTSPEIPSARKQLDIYCSQKGYEYTDIDHVNMRSIKADIIFYQKPYMDWVYPKNMRVEKHLYALFCYVSYAFHTVNENWGFNLKLFNYAWQVYYENYLVANEQIPFLLQNGKNVVVTGLPIQDRLNIKAADIEDPWIDHTGRKRIIYASHHTLPGMHLQGIGFSTFLDHCDFMLKMAEKYKDEVYFAFKPHPILYKNLLKLWGKERTDAYYDKWASLENGQLETGSYTGLFVHSDAMIHDCSSFTIEYHYTRNPVLYIVKDDHHADNLSILNKEAFKLHYKAKTQREIELFIQNVINGIDSLKQEREAFFKENLMPPHGKTACENIINSILGIEEYQ